MKFQSKLLSIAKKLIPKSIRSSIKAFNNLDDNQGGHMTQSQFENGGWLTYTTEDKSNFNLKTYQQTEYQDGSAIFILNQELIRTKVLEKNTFIKSDYLEVNKSINRQLSEIGWNVQFMEELFNGLYAGCGVFLLLFKETPNGAKIIAIPFVKNGEELVQVRYNYLNEVEEIQIINEKGLYEYLNLDMTDYYILYNIKIQDKNTYLSNLTLASPFIATEVALLKRDLDFARDGFNSIPVVSPKIEKTYKTDDDVRIDIGGVDYSYSEFLQKGFLSLKKQMEQEFQHNKIPIFPFPIEATTITTDNKSNATDQIRLYLSEQIQIACFSNGSVTGRDNTSNRSIGEQDRDNLEENTVLIFQKKLEKVVNDFLIPRLVPFNYREFKYQFYREATDESLRIRDQAQKTYEILVNNSNSDLLAKVGLSLNREQVKRIFREAHNIDLDDINLELEHELTNENTEVKIVKNNEFFTNSIKSVDLTKIKYLTNKDVINTKEYKVIKNKIIDALKKQYSDYDKSNSIKVDADNLRSFDKYFSSSEFKKAMEEISQITTNKYKEKINKDYVAKPSIFDNYIKKALKIHYEGATVSNFNDQGVKETSKYKGFNHSQKERLENKEKINTIELEDQALIDFDRVEGNLILPLFDFLYKAIAINDGADFVGTVAKNDKLTRRWHFNNSGTAHRIDSGILKDTTNPEYYLESWCRCSVVYGSRSDLINAGFIIYE